MAQGFWKKVDKLFDILIVGDIKKPKCDDGKGGIRNIALFALILNIVAVFASINVIIALLNILFGWEIPVVVKNYNLIRHDRIATNYSTLLTFLVIAAFFFISARILWSKKYLEFTKNNIWKHLFFWVPFGVALYFLIILNNYRLENLLN